MISGYCLGYNEEPAVTFNLSLCQAARGQTGEILIGNLTLSKQQNIFCYILVRQDFILATFLSNLIYHIKLQRRTKYLSLNVIEILRDIIIN